MCIEYRSFTSEVRKDLEPNVDNRFLQYAAVSGSNIVEIKIL